MKRIILSLVLVAGFAFLGTMEMDAQKAEAETAKATETTEQTARPGFIDANKDGVCDHYDGKRAGKGLGPGNGNGEGRATGQKLGRGKGLRDGSGQGLRNGSGRRQGKADGTGNGQRLRDGSGPGCTQAPTE
ncbi:hypothetical protein [Geofilum rubicundum]|uniref:Uncharacterized protein n=1 Tax=Geofilum rubicundum JCM 15548 TaxID=1236989 RepID=A0A0E9LT12_9BACT|nr:hypothetical protein [Geofilum rubicundum]GAO28296.1 hypothetical protein JCM15548_1371 [Geofilum rubicundum JCM 15548]